MSMFKKVKRNSLFMSLALIITFALLINLSPARAEGIEPDQITLGPFTFVPLLSGQSATINLTLSAAFTFHTVAIVSYGNPTLSVKSGSGDSDSFGFWTVSIVGSGGRNWFDLSTGFHPYTGDNAQIDVNSNLSFALATYAVTITDPGTGGFPTKASITVAK